MYGTTLDHACKLRNRVSIILLLHRPIAKQILLAQKEISCLRISEPVLISTPANWKLHKIIQYNTAMHVSLKRSNKHPSLYLHVWKMSFIKGRHLEFLAHNYDRATQFCALVGRFTKMGSMKSYDEAHPVFSVPERKAQVHYCDHALSVVRPSVCPSVRR